jgi:FkbM family methyltransferase
VESAFKSATGKLKVRLPSPAADTGVGKESARGSDMDFRIIHHHVGARGNVPLPLDPRSPIRKDFTVYYYDADADALTESLRSKIKVGEAVLLPYCLGEKRGKQTFHIANDPYASSLFPFNSRYENFSKATYLGQSRLGQSHAAAKRLEVDVVPLDEICEPGNGIPAPDYLSIDVEGAELDILRGAARVLSDSVVWLRSEMWIHPVYDGAATMEASLAHLKAAGFEVFHMEPYGEYEAVPVTLGMHGTGQTLGAEVDFHLSMRDFKADGGPGHDAEVLKIYKLALLAFLKGGNGLGYRALKEAEARGGTFFADESGTRPASFLDFLSEIWVVLRNMDEHLPRFPDLSRYVHDRRGRMFDYESNKDTEVRSALMHADHAARREVERKYRADLDWAHKLMWMDATPLESVFRKFGLTEQAGVIERNRKRHCQNFITLFYKLGDGPLR